MTPKFTQEEKDKFSTIMLLRKFTPYNVVDLEGNLTNAGKGAYQRLKVALFSIQEITGVAIDEDAIYAKLDEILGI